MNQYRYILDKSSQKYICPACGKRRFVRYIDTGTDKLLPEQYGKCDRKDSCNYHCNPYTDGYAKIRRDENKLTNPIDWKCKQLQSRSKPITKPVFIPQDVFQKTLGGYEQNVFIQNLLNNIRYPFNNKDIERVISLYHLGTIVNGYRAGATTFPFIDEEGNIRFVQVKVFDGSNHTIDTDSLNSIIDKEYTRDGKPTPKWVKAYQQNQIKASCLFGADLLKKYPYNPIALIEAPKTAIYGTLYFGFPENNSNLLWLAAYNQSSLNYDRCKVLQGRDVYLFPDLSKNGEAFHLWRKKAKELSSRVPNSHFEISKLLEHNACKSERDNGSDLADYLIKLDWRRFKLDQKDNTIKNYSESPIINKEGKKPEQKNHKENNILFELSDTPHSMNVDIYRDLDLFDESLFVDNLRIRTYIREKVIQVKELKNEEAYKDLVILYKILIKDSNLYDKIFNYDKSLKE